MAPGIERCFDSSGAIIGCGHSLDVVAEDMVCRLGTDGRIRIASPTVWERAVGVVVLGECRLQSACQNQAFSRLCSRRIVLVLRYTDRCQYSDDCDHDHQFNQSKAFGYYGLNRHEALLSASKNGTNITLL